MFTQTLHDVQSVRLFKGTTQHYPANERGQPARNYEVWKMEIVVPVKDFMTGDVVQRMTLDFTLFGVANQPVEIRCENQKEVNNP